MSLYEDNILSDENALARFWAKIEVTHPNDPDACWDWKAKKDKNGCAIFCMYCHQLNGNKYTWKSFRGPRLMWILEHDMAIPNGLYVIHSCDNESCLNPKHLRLGTQKDNMADRKARGRFDTGPKGEKHPHAVLTEKLVREICHLYFVKSMTPAAISRKLKITRHNVHGIISGRTWKHVTKTHIPKGFLHKYKACANRNEKMYKLFKDGWSYPELSGEYGISVVYARQIIRAKLKEHGDKPNPVGFRSKGRRKK